MGSHVVSERAHARARVCLCTGALQTQMYMLREADRALADGRVLLAGKLLRELPQETGGTSHPCVVLRGSGSQRSAPARGRAEQTSSCRGAVTPGSTSLAFSALARLQRMTGRSVALCFGKERLSTATGIRCPDAMRLPICSDCALSLLQVGMIPQSLCKTRPWPVAFSKTWQTR